MTDQEYRAKCDALRRVLSPFTRKGCCLAMAHAWGRDMSNAIARKASEHGLIFYVTEAAMYPSLWLQKEDCYVVIQPSLLLAGRWDSGKPVWLDSWAYRSTDLPSFATTLWATLLEFRLDELLADIPRLVNVEELWQAAWEAYSAHPAVQALNIGSLSELEDVLNRRWQASYRALSRRLADHPLELEITRPYHVRWGFGRTAEDAAGAVVDMISHFKFLEFLFGDEERVYVQQDVAKGGYWAEKVVRTFTHAFPCGLFHQGLFPNPPVGMMLAFPFLADDAESA